MSNMAKLITRNSKQNMQEELLVFGYSCKLFRDDEKSSFIDNGQHLIPFMSDQALLIDRYDVRGTLYDLESAASTGSALQMTEVEMKEEELCNEERYLALYHDLDAMVDREEEQQKRLIIELESGSSSFKQVGFSYDAAAATQQHVPLTSSITQQSTHETLDTQQQQQPSYMPQADDDTFIPPPTLLIPHGVVVPTSIKQHKVIVKTAKFIANQGTQMEIVLKTKQANNYMFGFLSFDHHLNQYYRHMIMLIKSGKYKEDRENNVPEKIPEASFNPPESAPGSLVPKANSGKVAPSPDCSYSKLISKIRENQARSGINIMPTDSRSQSPIVENPEPNSVIPSVPKVQSSTPLSSLTPYFTTPKSSSTKPLVGLVDYPSFNNTNEGYSDATTDSEMSDNDEEDFSKAILNGNNKKTINMVNYDEIKWPNNPYTQVVIDRIACNVVKHGPKFEQIMRTKSDVRFRFLQKNHEHHSYYQLKIKIYKDVFSSALDKSILKRSQNGIKETVERVASNIKKTIPNSTRKQMQTISFSIKQKNKEQDSKKVCSLAPTSFPLESSSSDDDTDDLTTEEKEKRKLEKDERRNWRRMKREQFEKEKIRIKEENDKLEQEKLKEHEEESGSSANEDMYDIFKYAQENNGNSNEDSKSSDVTPHSGCKIMKRKQAAHAFLSNLTKHEDQQPQIIGPQLPPEIAAQMMELEDSPPPSPPLSPPTSPPTSPPPLPVESIKLPLPPTEMELVSVKESVEAIASILPSALKSSDKLNKSSLLASALSNALVNKTDTADVVRIKKDSSIESYGTERSRKRKYKSRSRDKGSLSASPERRSSVSKKRKHHHKHHDVITSAHHKKHHKHHKSSSSSSRKKSSSRHKSKKSKKRKSKRYRRSSSRSSSSRSRSRSTASSSRSRSRSYSRSTRSSSRDSSSDKYRKTKSSNKDKYERKKTSHVKSDSDNDVQVISDTNSSRRSSRASSVLSVKNVVGSTSGGNGAIVTGGTNQIKEKALTNKNGSATSSRASSISHEYDGTSSKALSGTLSPCVIAARPLLPPYTLRNSSLSRPTKAFDMKTSNAMAKITEGLRAKVHAMMDNKK